MVKRLGGHPHHQLSLFSSLSYRRQKDAYLWQRAKGRMSNTVFNRNPERNIHNPLAVVCLIISWNFHCIIIFFKVKQDPEHGEEATSNFDIVLKHSPLRKTLNDIFICTGKIRNLFITTES